MDMSHHGHGHEHMNHMAHAPDMGRMDMATDSPMNMNSTDSGMHMGMKMYFHFGFDEVILFDWWRIDNVLGLVFSMLGIFVLAFLYEGLKYSREYLFRRSLQSSRYTSTSKNNITITDGQQPVRMGMFSSAHLIQTLLHMLQFLMSYFLMLIFMTYNTWLCLATLLGAGTGYFVFGWRKSVVVDITEHCH